MSRRYPVAKNGERIQPTMRGYKMRCCDCGLVHAMDFFVIPWGRGHKVQFAARRDNRATAASRRRKTFDSGTDWRLEYDRLLEAVKAVVREVP